MDVEHFTRLYLLCVLLAGLPDGACHRATPIELTGSTKESLLHSLLLCRCLRTGATKPIAG